MWQFSRVSKKGLLAFASVFLLAACSTAPENQYQDPYEKVNRKVYQFNENLDTFILKPVAQGYKFVTPRPVEQGIRNFFANLFYPTVFINAFLQGKVDEGVEGMNRFVFNSTFGLGGLIDISKDMGMQPREEDFGQTFAKWGFGSGPFIMTPVFGAYTMRDGLGDVVAAPTNPGYWVKSGDAQLGLLIGATVDRSAMFLDARELVTGDKYLFVRDTYLQRRKHLIADGAYTDEDPFLDD